MLRTRRAEGGDSLPPPHSPLLVQLQWNGNGCVVCVHLCLCAHLYVCAHRCVCVYVCVCVPEGRDTTARHPHASKAVCIRTYTHANAYTLYTSTRIWAYTKTDTYDIYMHTHMCIHVYVRIHVCVYTYTPIHMYTFMRILTPCYLGCVQGISAPNVPQLSKLP